MAFCLSIIAEKIKMQEDIFARGFKYRKVEIDKTFPEYILKNLDKYKNWII